MKGQSFLKRNWHLVFALYFPVYMFFFVRLERKFAVDTHYVHCFLDDMIPFCKYFIIPYYIWFLYIAVTVVFFYLHNQEQFVRYATFLVLGMSAALVMFDAWPSALTFRPEKVEGDDIFAVLTRFIYKVDTPTNVFPSLHCLNSFAAHIAVMKCDYFKKHKIYKYLSAILMVSIVISTVTLKQHSVLDVVAAVVFAVVLYYISYAKNGPLSRIYDYFKAEPAKHEIA